MRSVKKIAFDLDGVLRNQSIAYGEGEDFDPPIWDYKVDGKDLVEIVNSNPEIILKMPPTKLMEVANNLSYFQIWTVQPLIWVPYTLQWVEKHIKSNNFTILFFNSPEEKEKHLEKEDYLLIDDYPFFKDYSRIIVADHLYNQNIKNCFARVNCKENLEQLIFSSNTVD